MGGSILVISPWPSLWSLAPGAGVSDESHMLSGLVTHGYDIHMLVPRAAQGLIFGNGVTVHGMTNVLALPQRIPAPLRRLWLLPAFWGAAARSAVRLARRLRPRLVLGFSHYGAYPAWRAARAAGVPSVLKLFGVMQAMHLEWSLPRYLYHNLEAVLAFKIPLSHFLILNDGTRGNRVARRWGVPPERITWLPNGVNREWANLQLDREATRQRQGVSEEARVILSLARLVQSKRIDRIVDAVAAATAMTPTPLVLWVVGDGPLRRFLETRCRSRGVKAHFLGSVPHAEIPQLLAGADMLVSASEFTNMSIPTCEAMVVGTPVVALDVAGTSEVVRPMETGLLIDEKEPLELAHAIVQLAEDTSLRQRLGEGGRTFAARHFLGWDERVRREIELIDRLVASTEGGGGS